jgi:hypothetical protein
MPPRSIAELPLRSGMARYLRLIHEMRSETTCASSRCTALRGDLLRTGPQSLPSVHVKRAAGRRGLGIRRSPSLAMRWILPPALAGEWGRITAPER